MRRAWLLSVVVGTLVLATMAGAFIGAPPRAEAHAVYECGNCYGWVRWGGADGIQDFMTIRQPYCGACSTSNNFFINRDTWLGDNSSWANSNCGSYTQCWVEVLVNISAQGGRFPNCAAANLADCYAWADNRPCGGGYWEHYGTFADHDYGTNQQMTIAHVANGNENYGHQCQYSYNDAWNVNATSGWYGTGVSGQSTDNFMDPKASGGYMQVGLEIYGAYGQGMAQTDWTFNQYGFLQGGAMNWSYQANGGIDSKVNSPVSAWFASWPNGDTNNGGDWAAQCGC